MTTTLLEISERGAFIEAVPGLDELEFGDPVELSFAGEKRNASAAIMGAVVVRIGTAAKHVEHPSATHVALNVDGFGLEFTAAKNSELLTTLLKKADEI